MKVYRVAENEELSYLSTAKNLEETEEINSYPIRFSVIFVHKSDKDGNVFRALSPLPYQVKICSQLDAMLKNKDVEIIIDEVYWNELREEIEKVAVMHSALNTLGVRKDKDGLPKVDDNGRVKLFKIQPDMSFAGYSNIAKLYETAAPEVKEYIHMKSEFADELQYN